MLKRNTNLIIKSSLIAIFVILVVLIALLARKMPAEAGTFGLKDTSVTYPELTYAVYFDPDATSELLTDVRNAIKKLERINMRAYTDEAQIAMENELERLKALEARLSADLDKYTTWEEEHYYAAKVWEYFRQRGFNNEVTCAIIGNMMIETSGGTLDLNPTIYSKSGNYYGLCQWSLKYCPGTKDLPFEHQLDYLLGSMPWEFNTFGKKYRSGFKYEDFIAMTDVEEAALAFAQSYERCYPVSFKMRQEAALLAYEYFDFGN